MKPKWHVGWIPRVAKTKGTFSVYIDKRFARSFCLKMGMKLHAYGGFIHDRPVMMVFLDGKNMEGEVEDGVPT